MPLEDRHLLLGEGRPAGRNHVLNPAQEHRNAVHLPFHQQGKPGLPDHAARLVQVEQHLSLRVERRLRRIDVLRSGFLAGLERSGGKGDHPPAFVRDGEHDPLAKPVVERPLGPIVMLFRTEEAGGPQRLSIGYAAQPLLQRVEAVRRIANVEFFDSFWIKSAARQVLTRHRPLRAS